MWKRRLLDPRTWRDVPAVAGLIGLTAAVAVVYAVEPLGPRDMLDRVALMLDEAAYGPNLRVGERRLKAALRAEDAGQEVRADSLQVAAAQAFVRAAEAAPDPRQEMLANDRAADAYLLLGRRHLARGRGNRFGLGVHAGALGVAERAAACMVGLAPTRRRGQINAFLVELEAALERPLEASCPW